MPNTYVDYTATASQTDFAFSFPYLEDAHVVVEIDGVASTAFSIVTSPSTKVVLNAGATVGQKIRVRRDSNASIAFVDFVNGSVLTEKNLDDSYLHNLYLNEEIGELNATSLQKEIGGANWDAQSLKITNLGDPTLSQDAVTKSFLDTKITNAITGSTNTPSKETFTGDNTTTAFTFSPGIDLTGDTLYEVAIDGVLQEPTVAYAINSDTDTITFTSAPPTGANIVIVTRGYSVPVSTGTITNSQITNDAIDGTKIADSSINSEHIVNGSVDRVHLANDVIDGSKIADDSINSEHYVDGSIDTAHLADGTVTADKISSTDAAFSVSTGSNATSTIKAKGTSTDTTLFGGGGGTLLLINDSPGVDKFCTLRLENTSSDGTNYPTAEIRGVSGGDGETASKIRGFLSFLVTDALGTLNEALFIKGGETETDSCKVGINTKTPSSPLEVNATTGGVIFPRLTDTQMNAVSTPTNGEMIYNTTLNKFYGYANGAWVVIH